MIRLLQRQQPGRRTMNTLASQVQADIAYAELQNAYANIFASVGIDPYDADLKSTQSIGSLSSDLQKMWIERGDTSGVARATAAAKRYRQAANAAHDATVTGSVVPDNARTAEAPAVVRKRRVSLGVPKGSWFSSGKSRRHDQMTSGR